MCGRDTKVFLCTKLKYENNERYIWHVGVMVGILILPDSCMFIYIYDRQIN